MTAVVTSEYALTNLATRRRCWIFGCGKSSDARPSVWAVPTANKHRPAAVSAGTIENGVVANAATQRDAS